MAFVTISSDIAHTKHPLRYWLRVLRNGGVLRSRGILRNSGVLRDHWVGGRATASRSRVGRIAACTGDASSLEQSQQHEATHDEDSAYRATDDGAQRSCSVDGAQFEKSRHGKKLDEGGGDEHEAKCHGDQKRKARQDGRYGFIGQLCEFGGVAGLRPRYLETVMFEGTEMEPCSLSTPAPPRPWGEFMRSSSLRADKHRSRHVGTCTGAAPGDLPRFSTTVISAVLGGIFSESLPSEGAAVDAGAVDSGAAAGVATDVAIGPSTPPSARTRSVGIGLL